MHSLLPCVPEDHCPLMHSFLGEMLAMPVFSVGLTTHWDWDGNHRSPVLVVPVVPMSLTIISCS